VPCLSKEGSREEQDTEPSIRDANNGRGKNMKNQVKVWVSSEKNPGNSSWYKKPEPVGHKLDEKELQFAGLDDSNVTTIKVDPSKTYQEILGIGTSVEESTVYNLMRMSPEKRREVLVKLVDKEKGIGMSLLRLTIGTADFTGREFYTYDDMPPGQTDYELKHFSIQKDFDYHIIDIIKEIQEINPEIKFFASPWSPPGWMKEPNPKFSENNELNLRGGALKTECIPCYAKYLRKYVEEYEKLGIHIHALTLQNEPLLEINYPSCYVTPEQERLLAIALKKELKEAGLDTRIWVFDHNMSEAVEYVKPILSDPQGFEAVDGVAFHDYSGDPSAMTEVHELFPQKTVGLTERSWWGVWGADRICQYFRNWSISYNMWVTMLDSDIKPHQWVGTPDPTLLVQDAAPAVNGYYDNYWICPEYYLIGQFSKFVRPGAVRIDSNNGTSDTITNVAFKNPDNTIAVVVINQQDNEHKFKIQCMGKQINDTIPAKSVATYVWGI